MHPRMHPDSRYKELRRKDLCSMTAKKQKHPDEIAEIHGLLKNSAQRARQGSHPSNVVNVLFLGSRQQMDRAFQAAGWSRAEGRSPISLYRMYYALTTRVGYRRAPMDILTLNGVPSDFEYQFTPVWGGGDSASLPGI